MGNSTQSKPTPRSVIEEFKSIKSRINKISDMTTHLRENIQVYHDGYGGKGQSRWNHKRVRDHVNEFDKKARIAERIRISTKKDLEKQEKTVASESKAETIGTGSSMRNQIMLSITLASFAECEMDFYNVLVTYETAIRDNVRMKLKIVNPSMTEECRTTILDQGRALEVLFDNVIRAGPHTRGPYDEWPPKIISRKWLSCHDGKAMFSNEKFHLCCSMQQRVYFEFSIRRRVQRRRR